MKRRLALLLAALAALALFAVLVHVVLVAAHVSEPAPTTVQGATVRRMWATAAVLLGLAGAVACGVGFARPAGRFGSAKARVGGVVAGVVAALNGACVLAVADGGPGTGNGVVGGAAALVLGLLAIAVAALRRRRVPA